MKESTRTGGVTAPSLWLSLLSSLFLGACATQPAQPPPAPAAAETAEVEPIVSSPEPTPDALSASLLFDILLGEIAGQRGEMTVSVPHYLRAATETDDPRVAERALRISLYAKQTEPALIAARRWVELEPDSREGRQALAALSLRQGLVDEAMVQLDYLLFSGAERGPAAYQQLSAMLAREPEPGPGLEVMALLAERHPGDAQLHLAYARLAAHGKEWPLAMEQVEQTLGIEPDLSPALILRAQIQLEQQQRDAAVAGLKAAVERQPEDSSLRLAYARLLVEDRDMDAAREQFRILARQEPDNSTVLYSLALLALEGEQLDDAERYFRKLIDLDKQAQEARYYLGHIAEVRGDDEAALDWYGQVEPGEQWLEVQVRMARIQADGGDLDAARARLADLRTQDPVQSQRLYLLEGEILSRVERYQEAFDLYTEMLDREPGNHDVLYARSLVAEKLDRLDLLESDLRTILREKPDDVRALNALGYTLADRTDRYAEALGYIERAAAQSPDDPAIIDSLGWVHFRLGNLEEARQHLQRAYDMSKDGEIGAHLGEVLWQMGDQVAARQTWDDALENDPDNPVLRKTRERFLR